MSRKNPAAKKEAAGRNKPGGREKRLRGAERSAYFARREAAKVLRTILQGDSRRRAVGSIKSLVYSPSVRNKKATYALVCETLKRKLATSTSIFLCCVSHFFLNSEIFANYEIAYLLNC